MQPAGPATANRHRPLPSGLAANLPHVDAARAFDPFDRTARTVRLGPHETAVYSGRGALWHDYRSAPGRAERRYGSLSTDDVLGKLVGRDEFEYRRAARIAGRVA